MNDKNQEVLRNLLKEIRLSTNLKQIDIASKLKKTQSYVSKYESGEKILTFYEVYKICETLEIAFIDFSRKYEEKLNEEYHNA